jgi:hypothetical protein
VLRYSSRFYDLNLELINLGHAAHLELDIHPPVRWGKGYKGTAATQFPHPNIYSLQDCRIPLDQLTGTPPHTHVQHAKKKISLGP